MATHLTTAMETLKKMLLSLAALSEEQLEQSVKAFKERNAVLARSVIEKDSEIDRIEVDLEEECLKTLALYQPVAYNLRFIVSVLKINNDLERIGDLAVNISQRCVGLAEYGALEGPFEFLPMAQKAQLMLKQSIDSLIEQNTDLARNVIREDPELNRIHHLNHKAVYKLIPQHPEDSPFFFFYLSISRYLERVGDLATNIAEDVIYLIEGKIVRHRGISI
jgi:phosphate transport system protein